MPRAPKTWIVILNGDRASILCCRMLGEGLEPVSRLDPKVEEEPLVGGLAHALAEAGGCGRYDKLILVAPARRLGALCDRLEPATAAKVSAMLAKDLAQVPRCDWAQHLGSI